MEGVPDVLGGVAMGTHAPSVPAEGEERILLARAAETGCTSSGVRLALSSRKLPTADGNTTGHIHTEGCVSDS